MLRIEIYNFNELEESFKDEIRQIIKNRQTYYENLFKKYPKDLLLEIKFNRDNAYRVSLNINMQSKDIRIVETGKDPVEVLRKAFAEFKKTVKRQLALERKDYLYKRKRYRQQKWKNILEEIAVAEPSAPNDETGESKPRYSRKIKNALQGLRKYLKGRLKELGLTKKQIKAQLPVLLQAVEKEFYQIFDPKQHQPGDMDALLYGLAEKILARYQNTQEEAEGEESVVEFEGDHNAPQAPAPGYEEMYFLDDISTDENLIDKVNQQMEAEQIHREILAMVSEKNPGEQAVLHLHYLEQYSPEETAAILGQSTGDVQRTLDDFRRKTEDRFRELTR